MTSCERTERLMLSCCSPDTFTNITQIFPNLTTMTTTNVNFMREIISILYNIYNPIIPFTLYFYTKYTNVYGVDIYNIQFH